MPIEKIYKTSRKPGELLLNYYLEVRYKEMSGGSRRLHSTVCK